MHPEPSAFGQWVKERLQRCDHSQNQMAQATDYHRSGVTRFLNGERKPPPEFVIRTLFALWNWKALDHPAEAMDGAALLGIPPEQVLQLAQTLAASESRCKFQEFLQRWNYPFVAPQHQVYLPETYVERPALMNLLRSLLTGPNPNGGRRRLVLWGMGGAGKTLLARAIALDPTVLRTFRNGLLWASLSEGDPAHWLRHWARLLRLPLRGDESPGELRARLQEALRPPYLRFLLVLDDIWKIEDAQPLLIENPRSAVILTLRERHLAQKLAVDDWIIEVGIMEDEEAEQLVRRRMGAHWREADREQVEEFIQRVDRLPLALEIGAAVAKDRGWTRLLERLRAGDQAISALNLNRPDRREYSLRITLDWSYEHLPPEEQQLLERLGILAPGETFTLWDVFYTWFSPTMLAMKGAGKEWQNKIWDNLQGLVDASLVTEEMPIYRHRPHPPADARPATESVLIRRYRLHPLVALYAREKAEQRGWALSLWKEYIQNGLDILTLGVGKGPGGQGLPPSGQRALLEDHWPQVEQAWREARKRWQKLPEGDEGVGIAERALHWAYHFGRLGAQVLARWGDWEEATRWTQEALALYREAYREGWNQEPGGEPWNILLINHLDGLLQLGEQEKAADVLKQLQKEDFGPRTAAWRLRLRVRKTRLRMLSEKIPPRALRRIADRIAFDADAWLGEVHSDLAWHTLAEVCLLRGDIAARCGQAAEAEAYWWEACGWIALLIPFGDDYGFDEWTLEEVAARVAFWRAEHGMGREAARAGKAWVALRRYLGEAVSQPLVDIARWGLAGGDEEAVEWALQELEREGNPETEGARRALRGFLQARRGETAEALSLLRAALERFRAAPGGEPTARLLEEAIGAVETGRPLPPFLQARAAPYEVPCDWTCFPPLTFEQWLEDTLRSWTKERRGPSVPPDWGDTACPEEETGYT